MRKKDVIIIIIFIFFLFIPNILYWFVKDKMDHTNYEARTLYEKPQLEISSITSFPSNYENYYNDNLAFKNEIRNERLHVLKKYFNTNGILKIIEGEDGWLFYNSDLTNDGDTIRAYRKTSRYSSNEKKVIKTKLLEVNKELKKRNVDFYILVAPNRENVYSDKLENVIKRSNNKYSKVEGLINYLNKTTNLKIIYPKKELIENRKNAETCYKYDTHWNDYGAYIGTMELMKAIDKNFEIPDVKIELEDDYTIGLAIMNMQLNVNNKEPIVKGFYDDINASCEVEDHFQKCESDNPIYDKNIMMVGDSFRDYTVKYLSKIYKNSVFVHRNFYDQDYISKYNIDIVVYEAVERYSGNIYGAEILINR